ncbi:WecB/TagA/CpsF family glycosyltransferase [Pseudomonadota bacterium]
MKFTDSGTTNTKSTRVSLFELPLDIGIDSQNVLEGLTSEHFLLSYLNPYAYSVAKSNLDYASNLNRFDLVVCDGIGIQTAVKAVFKLTTPILSLDYSGIGHDYLQFGAERKMHLCMVGSEKEVVDKAASKINNRYPGFGKITAFSGYGESANEAKKFILESEPDLVLAGLGMGLQESYMIELVSRGWQGVGICVGGFFDKLAKPQVNYPKWTEKTRMRFLGRLIKEPRRLSRRYFIDYQPFIGMYLKHILGRG